MLIHFSKMHGLGNDFVVIDAISQRVNLTAGQIRFIAERRFGVGCDQLLLVENSEIDGIDFKYRIFNADGGEVEQCGNGARCFARFVKEKGLIESNKVVVETAGGIITLLINQQQMVSVNMGAPRFDPLTLPFVPGVGDSMSENRYALVIKDRLIEDRVPDNKPDGKSAAGSGIFKVEFSAVSMGNPHITLKVTDLNNYPVKDIGKILESHPSFPKRVNVGFMQIIDRTHLRLRVYERGSGETLACGTGACAAVANGISRGWLDESVEVLLPAGSLQIEWQPGVQDLIMTGPANFVFEGKITL
jgi:diaminopimelate epimerase